MRASGKFITKISTAVALGASLLSGTAAALPSDPSQPIEIEAGNAMRDERRGVTVYEQDVTIRQGSILITADRVSVHTVNNQVDHIVATGRPARYQQQLNPNESPIIARASTIEYLLTADQIQLVGNASLEQAGSTLTGNRIDYDLLQEVIRASGEEGGRVRMVIPPDLQQGAAEPEAEPTQEGSVEERADNEDSAP